MNGAWKAHAGWLLTLVIVMALSLVVWRLLPKLMQMFGHQAYPLALQ